MVLPDKAENGREPSDTPQTPDDVVVAAQEVGEATGLTCSACSEEAPEGAKFCEACGQDLNTQPKPICVACGEGEVADDGYCHSCGQKQPEERDHHVLVDGRIAAGSDRGRRHHHNEDAFAVANVGTGAVLVVCDGVSSTPGSADASLAAANATRETFLAGLGAADIDSDVVDVEELLVAAVASAQTVTVEVATASGSETRTDPPSSTLVAAFAAPVDAASADSPITITVAWLGDSRAYWLGASSILLTTDHEIGGSLSRWIGADSPDARPETSVVTVDGPGLLVVCSDGLWRYGSEPTELEALVLASTSGTQTSPPSAEMVEALLKAANDGGGHDNITVAVWSSTDLGRSTTETPDQQDHPEEVEEGTNE